MSDSDGDILEQLAAIAQKQNELSQKQDELILLFAGRLDWSAAENAARFPGGEYPYSEFEERDGLFEVHHSYPIAASRY